MVQHPSLPSSGSDGPASPSSGRINVPHQTKDPISSLCPWPLSVEVGGKSYAVPAWSAADWLHLLMDTEQLSADRLVVDLVTDGVHIVMDESISSEEIVDLGLDLLEAAGGRPWYIIMRLVHVLRENWNVLGADMLKDGLDPTRVSLSGFLDVTLLQTLRSMDSKDITMFLMQLEMPPLGVEIPEEDMEMTREQFLSLAD